MPGFITLADAKKQLVVLDEIDDGLIQDLVDAASKHAEARTGYVAENRAEIFLFDRFTRHLELRLRPVDADSVALQYLDANGDLQSFTDIRVIVKNGTTRVVPAIGFCWPCVPCAEGVITVTADVGLGADEAAISAAAPANVKHAVRLCVGSWYDDREVGAVPQAAGDLLEDERARRV
jgi:uncharacterized phiE125 gp8 family phage protein